MAEYGYQITCWVCIRAEPTRLNDSQRRVGDFSNCRYGSQVRILSRPSTSPTRLSSAFFTRLASGCRGSERNAATPAQVRLHMRSVRRPLGLCSIDGAAPFGSPFARLARGPAADKFTLRHACSRTHWLKGRLCKPAKHTNRVASFWTPSPPYKSFRGFSTSSRSAWRIASSQEVDRPR